MANLTIRIVDELQSVRERRIPFEITREVPNADTVEAIKEVKQMKKDPSLGKSYTDVDEKIKGRLEKFE